LIEANPLSYTSITSATSGLPETPPSNGKDGEEVETGLASIFGKDTLGCAEDDPSVSSLIKRFFQFLII
jgi:hypothetical protein